MNTPTTTPTIRFQATSQFLNRESEAQNVIIIKSGDFINVVIDHCDNLIKPPLDVEREQIFEICPSIQTIDFENQSGYLTFDYFTNKWSSKDEEEFNED